MRGINGPRFRATGEQTVRYQITDLIAFAEAPQTGGGLDFPLRRALGSEKPNANPCDTSFFPAGSFCARRKSVVVVRAFPVKFVPGFDRYRDERLHRKHGPNGPQRFAEQRTIRSNSHAYP